MATWGLWGVGLTLIVLACVEVVDHPFAILGLALVAFGCTVQIGTWVSEVADSLENAFELGRDSVRQLRP